MERYIAIDDVCAWPNLTVLADGTLAVAIYNRPVHGRWHGDVEIWASTDEGCSWQKRGTAAPGEPPGNRMNVAAGAAANGDLIVIASGWTPVLEPGSEDPEFAFRKRRVLDARVCRSADGGSTWERADTVTVADASADWFIPFGDIVEGPNGLAVPFYSSPPEGKRNTAWMLASTDDGRTWQDRGPLTLPGQHPPHLAHLKDGRILLTYGIRNEGLYGVAARFSDDAGNSWSAPRILVALEGATDGGYPSSTECEGGTIVTAYYANKVVAHRRYHMGVVRWQADA